MARVRFERWHTRKPDWYRVVAVGTAIVGVGGGCTEETGVGFEPLVDDPSAVIAVYVVQTLDPGATLAQSEPVEIHNRTGETVVAVADADPRVVPIAFGEPTADPTSDYMLVSVQVESDFVDDIAQVELNIDLGADGGEDWCHPMLPDPVVPGGFYLKLQPACPDDDRDPLTGECVVSTVCDGYLYGCRQDLLTFTLWDDISSVCHGEAET